MEGRRWTTSGSTRKALSRRTRAVHAGIRRSQYGEVSEAIFLTQGFVYDTAEAAEARFIEAGPDEFIYARYGNPTTRMFEERMAVARGHRGRLRHRLAAWRPCRAC